VSEPVRRTSTSRKGARFEPFDYAEIPLSRPREDDASARPVHVHVETALHDDGAPVAFVTVDASVFAEVVVPNGHVFTLGSFSTPDKPLCAPGRSPLATAFGLLPARWTKESLELAWYDGKLDGSTCTATLRERDHATASALIPGLVYGARVADAGGASESLWLVMPPAVFISTAPVAPARADGPFTTVVLPVRRGATTSATVVTTGDAASDWLARASSKRLVSPIGITSRWSITIDVAWVRGESTPEASYSVSDVSPPPAKP
jgi:hypothetical protein